MSFFFERVTVTVDANSFNNITAIVQGAAVRSSVVDGLVLISSLSDVASVFVAVNSEDYLTCLSSWLSSVTSEPEARPYRDRPDAVHVMKRTVMKKEILLALTDGTLELSGEDIFFASFGEDGEEVTESYVIAILGSPDTYHCILPQQSCPEHWRTIAGTVEGALSQSSVTGGLCLVSTCSPHNPVYINDWEGGLQSDYQDFQRYWTDSDVVGVETATFRSQLGRVLMGRELCIGVTSSGGGGSYRSRGRGRGRSSFDFGHWEVPFWCETETCSTERRHHRFPNTDSSVLVKILGAGSTTPPLKLARRQTGCGSRQSPRFEVTDLTPEVEDLLSSSGISQGLVLVNSLHITSGVCVMSPSADSDSFFEYGDPYTPGTEGDFLAFLRKLCPDQYPSFKSSRRSGDYEHNGGGDVRSNPYSNNGDAHHKRQIVSRQTLVPVVEGELVLGEGQRVWYVECDGQRTKNQLITIVGI